ncbi:MAG: hypothetical protein J5802_13205 [Butyrivibrio sp.]|nr:hypothetical protein [Butyrivibrio sp.]
MVKKVSLFSVVLVLALMGCSTDGKDAKKVDSSEDFGEYDRSLYKSFLRSEVPVYIDKASNVERRYSFEKIDNKDCTLAEVAEGLVEHYDEDDLFNRVALTGIEYTYLDCGKDGNEELALRMNIDGGESHINYMIVKEFDGKLRTVYCNSQGKMNINDPTVFSEYGYISIGEEKLEWEDLDYYCSDTDGYVDADGKYHYISCTYDDERIDLNNTPGDNADDLHFFKREEVKGINVKEIYRTSPQDFSEIPEDFGSIKVGNDDPEKDYSDYAPDIDRRATEFKYLENEYKDDGIKLYAQNQIDVMIASIEKEAGLTQEIKSGKVLKWTDLDYSEFYKDAEQKNDAGYSLYDRFIEKIRTELKNSDKATFDPNHLGISERLRWEMDSSDYVSGYVQKDIDGDGINELLLGSKRMDRESGEFVENDSNIWDIFTVKEGKLYHLYTYGDEAFEIDYSYFPVDEFHILSEN